MLLIINPLTSVPLTDFNQKDTQYQSFQKKYDTPYIDQLFNQKMKEIHKNLKYDLESKNDLIKQNSYACLDCMNSFLIQGLRIKNHLEQVHNNLQYDPLPRTENSLIAINSINIMTDYESMLYHARSTLDRMCFYIANQLYRYKKSDNFGKSFKTFFSKVKPDVNTFEANLSLLEVYDTFKGILIDFDDSKTGLRSLLAHSKSHDEAIKGNFSIVFLSKNEYLFFDQELIKSIGLLESTLILLNHLPFLLLNLLSIFSGSKHRISIADCKVTWDKTWVNSNEYLTGTTMQTFTKVKLRRSDFVLDSISLSSKVLDHKNQIN